MNKKFFTLLATVALLFSTAFAASAATPVSPAAKLSTATLYHLWTGSKFLNIENDTLKLASTVSGSNLLSTLWCASAEQPSGSLYPSFTFTNKGAEEYLSVNIDSFAVYGKKSFPAVIGDGDVSEWKFSSTYLNALDPSATYLASYIKTDTIAVLATDATGKVFVDIVPAPSGSSDPSVASGHTLLKVQLATAANIQLNAAGFNTLLGAEPNAKGRKLTFIPDVNGVQQENPFSKYVLSAKDASSGYVKFAKGSAKSDTLRVDTSYVNAQGVNFLGFKFDSIVPTISGQYEFKLTYYPSYDSLTIQVKDARYKKVNGTSFFIPTDSVVHDQFVSIQDLVKADQIRIITVAGQQNTRILFGLGSTCSNVGDTRSTLAEDLYYIRNKDGKYLVAPIYTDSSYVNGDKAKATWVSLEANVTPSRLPAYQWVVEKAKTASKYASTSPIKITNREYYNVILSNSYQLYKNGLGDTIPSIGIALDSTYFSLVSVDYPNVKKDATLGYKAIVADTALVTTYNFNYLHQFNDAKYLNVTNDKNDTLIYVADAKTSFQLIPQSALANFGKKTSSIAQLTRVSYKLVIKDTYKFNQVGKYVAIDSLNDRYTLVTDAAKASVFFLKENNYKNGKPYYALVDTTTTDVVKYHSGFVKAAIDDNNVYAKINPITEIRTSAFALDVNDDPLYRRFDGKLGTVSESNATDAADTLEIYRAKETSDVLYENAHDQEGEYGRKDLTINFLGVRNKTLLQNDGIKRNYSLLVDTAYVNRGTGKIKPQYLVSLRPGAIADSTSTVCNTCGTTVEQKFLGYQRRWFLINTTQFAKDAAKVTDYQWNTKWDRLAFVEGVRRGDSLYIFQPGYSPADRIDFNTLKSLPASKVRFYNLGNNLHKDVVWQFRLINNVVTDLTKTFLIESENEYRIGGATTPDGNGVSTGTTVVAPLKGGWVKIQNGVPVISRGFYSDAITDAEQFNVKASHEAPVATEDLAADAVVVIGGQGTVTIKGAAGKTVSISNVLGQTVAKQVLSSDEATISAPKGIVVVAVEGEKAVKAVVK